MFTNRKPASRKKYPGFYPCPWHDILTETMKETPKTFCKKCFGEIAERHNQLLGNALVRTVLNRRMIIEMGDRIEKILASSIEKIENIENILQPPEPPPEPPNEADKVSPIAAARKKRLREALEREKTGNHH